ncbi:peptidylprolyl isomerase [Kiloniella sp. b19]|uniref:peptidylprolyl isomerase n=1 Tax=Kiloniella sp. GXU_MW_B19 TaxID=3141326 RepID=UPI0031D1E05B
MQSLFKRLVPFVAALVTTLGLLSTPAAALDPENALVIELKNGRVVIEMLPDLAPNHVARIKELAREGFYDGIVFHRVIDGFMAQTGDPTGTGRGGSGKNLAAEFSREPFARGIVGMARSQNPNSGDSQFFIMFDRAASLDGQYTVWGRVVEGMDKVDTIKRGSRAQNGAVSDPDRMLSVRVLADIQ